MQKLIIQGELTDFNTYDNAARTNRYAGADIKKRETLKVFADCKNQKIKRMPRIEEMIIEWYSPNRRKDTDNIEFAKKFIMDGLRDAKVIDNDTRKHTGSTIHFHFVDKRNPRIEVELR